MSTSVLSSKVEVCQNPARGRHLRCSKPLMKGELVLTESPFAHTLDDAHIDRLCFTCLRPSEGIQHCTRCGLVGYCSDSCRDIDQNNHQKECRSAQQVRPHRPTPTLRLMLRVLRRLEVADRCERRSSDSPSVLEQYDALLSHEEHVPIELREQYAQMAKLVRDCRLPGESLMMCHDLAAMVHAFARLATNTFHLLDDDLQPVGSALFLTASVLNHSCQPNAVAVFNGPILLVRAIDDLKAREEVTISYVDLAASTDQRQQQLRTRYYFQCQCERCTDLSRDVELGRLTTSTDVRSPSVQHRLDAVVAKVQTATEHQRSGQYSLAIERYSQALRQANGLLGARHLLRHRAEDGLVHCAIAAQDFETAFDHCERTVSHYMYIYGEVHPMLGLQYATYGKLAWYLQHVDVAEDCFRRALEVLHLTHGKDHPLVKDLEALHQEVLCCIHPS